MKNMIKKILLPMVLAFVLVVPSITAFAATNVIPAILQVEGFEEREIISYSYSFDQPTNEKNEIAGNPKMTSLKIRVKASNDGNSQLQQWMLAPDEERNAKIIVYNTIDNVRVKTFDITDALCVKHNFVYGDSEYGDYEDIEILCKGFKDGPVEYENKNKNLTGTTISNSSNNIVIICCSAVAIVVVAAAAIIVAKKKNKK